LPTQTLNEKLPTASTISLSGLKALGAKEVDFAKLSAAISKARRL